MSRTYRPSKHSQLCDTLLRPHYIDRTSDLHLFHMQGRRHAIVEVVQIHLTEYVVILELTAHVTLVKLRCTRACVATRLYGIPIMSRCQHHARSTAFSPVPFESA